MVMQYFGRVAVFQGGSVPGNVAANLATVQRVADDAVGYGAHTVVFPELFLAGYDIGADRIRATAIALSDPVITEVYVIAREHALNLILPFAERRGDKVAGRAPQQGPPAAETDWLTRTRTCAPPPFSPR